VARDGYKGKLILPVLLTNQRQMNKKTERNPKTSLAATCIDASRAEGIWVVDSSLNDQEAKGNFGSVRFRGVVDFHQELNAMLTHCNISVAGPYWGMNLVVWARGIVSFAAVGVGKAYRYHIPGGLLKQSSTKFALPSLRRLVVRKPILRSWLVGSLQKIAKSDPAYSEFSELVAQFGVLADEDMARHQIGRFYENWIRQLEAAPPQSRSLALYQNFSSAYVLGKSLSNIPSEEGPARSPSRIAEQFMRNCL